MSELPETPAVGQPPARGGDLAAVLAIAAGAQPVSPDQLAFSDLVDRLGQQRALLGAWQAFSLRYRHRVGTELWPARRALQISQRTWVVQVDQLLSPPAGDSYKALTRAMRNRLTQWLLALAPRLLNESPDGELEAVFDRYSEDTWRTLCERQMAGASRALTRAFGLALPANHGARTPEELVRHAARTLEEQQARQTAKQQERRTARQAQKDAAREAKRRASPGGQECAAQLAAPQTSPSVRAVYRQLASALHPDREQDATQRDHKTVLMQRVNQAYDSGDLLTLLNLQLEIEHIDATHAARASEPPWAQFNKVLRDQLRELQAELGQCMAPFSAMLPRRSGLGAPELTTEAVEAVLEAELTQLQQHRRDFEEDVAAFSDPNRLRERLALRELAVETNELDVLLAWDEQAQAEEDAARGRRRKGR